MCLFPLPVVPETEILEIGPALFSVPMVITSIMDVRVIPDSVLKQLFRFSEEIIVLLVVSVYALSFVLTRSERTRIVSQEEQTELRKADTKFLGSLWYLLHLMALQANYDPKTMPGKVLIVVTSIGVLFWYAIWGNLMTSDNVSYDTSRTINNLDDVFRLNTSLYMVSSDPAVRLLEIEAETNPKSIVGRMIYNYSYILRESDNTKIKEVDPQAEMQRIQDDINKLNDTVMMNKAVVSTQVLIDQFESLLCKFRDGNKTKWDHQLQRAVDHRLPYAPFSPWISRRLDPELRLKIFKGIRKVSESGLIWNIYFEANAVVEQMLQIAKKGSCIVKNAERYVQDLMMSSDDEGIFVSIQRVYDVFVLYCACIVISVATFAIEKSKVWDSAEKKYQLSMEELQQKRVGRRMEKQRKKLFKITQKKKLEEALDRVAILEDIP